MMGVLGSLVLGWLSPRAVSLALVMAALAAVYGGAKIYVWNERRDAAAAAVQERNAAADALAERVNDGFRSDESAIMSGSGPGSGRRKLGDGVFFLAGKHQALADCGPAGPAEADAAPAPGDGDGVAGAE